MASYDIYFKNEPIGIAYVESAGLYTHFKCRCNFPAKGSYRVIAQYSTSQIDLGLCVPQDNLFVTNAKVATKKLNTEIPYIFAMDTKYSDQTFIPVDPKKEFGYITKLEKARFSILKNIRGILVSNDYCKSSGVISSK